MGSVLLVAILALAADAASAPQPSYAPAVRAPADACFGHTRTCAATVTLTVVPDGSVTSVAISESSGDRACDNSIRHGVSKWRYEPRAKTATVRVKVDAYTCPLTGTG